MSEERQGSTLGFCLREVSFLQRQMLLGTAGTKSWLRFREASVLSQIL